MKKIIYDARWVGQYGIARYAHETTSRLNELNFKSLHSRQSPLSPVGLLAWQAKVSCNLLFDPSSIYYSPSFTPVYGFNNRQVITVHDLIHLDIAAERSSVKEQYYENIVKPVVINSPAVITVSEYSKKKVVEWSGVAEEKIFVTGNAASSEFTTEGSTRNLPYEYILYVGNTKPHKNIDMLYRLLTDVSQELHLVIIGQQTNELAELAHQLGVSNRVHSLTQLAEAELAQYYRGARLFIMPSVYEGFGIPVLEAMACGTPVLTSNTTSLPEVAGAAALYFNPYNYDELVEKTRYLLGSSSILHDMTTKGLQQAKQFSWEKNAEIIQEVLTSL